MPSARRATVSVAVFASASAVVALGRGRDQLGAGPGERGHRRQRVHDLVRQHAHQVGLRRDFERAELALHRQDRQHRDRLVEPRHLRRGEDRLLRHAVEDQPRDLARARRQPDGRRQLGPERFEILDPVERMAGEQLPRRLVEDLDAPVRDRRSARRSAHRRRSPRDSALRRFPRVCRA